MAGLTRGELLAAAAIIDAHADGKPHLKQLEDRLIEAMPEPTPETEHEREEGQQWSTSPDSL